MYAKLISLLFLVSAIAAANLPHQDECIKGKNHSLKLGSRVAGDREVYEGMYSMSTSSGVLEKDISWSSDNNEQITYIEVLDLNKDGLGGCANVVSGGVGQKSVKIHMRTINNGSFRFLINIYVK